MPGEQSIWNQAFHPNTYIDGYGTEREGYVSPQALRLRKLKRFFNGPTDENGNPTVMGDLGVLTLVSPMSNAQWAAKGNALLEQAKNATNISDINTAIKEAKSLKHTKIIDELEKLKATFKSNVPKSYKANPQYIIDENKKVLDIIQHNPEIPDTFGEFPTKFGISRLQIDKKGGIIKRR